MRNAYALLCSLAVVAWIAALIAGASFAVDLAYTCGLLGAGAYVLERLDRRRGRRA